MLPNEVRVKFFWGQHMLQALAHKCVVTGARGSVAIATLVLFAACRTVPAPAIVPGTDQALPPSVIPAPASLTRTDALPFTLVATTAIVAEGGADVMPVAEALADRLRPATGFPLPVRTTHVPGAAEITLSLGVERAPLGEEGYELRVETTAIRLVAYRAAGLFRGVQTIRQLLPASIESDMRIGRVWAVPSLVIADQPRFAWRGAMLDVSRHFFTVREVRQFIDILALYKFNVLHLHLSDDQGWRVEIRSRPLLATVGGARQVGGGPGGYYTQEDYASLVAYAAARFITVVPEIDMPGHSNAALSAYPAVSCSARAAGTYTGTDVGWSTFCVDNPETYALIEDVVRELAALTPGPFLHIGGDEVQTLTPVQYATFVERVQQIVGRYGKRMIGWEEVAHVRLLPTSVAQHWRSDSVVKALAFGARLVLSPASRSYLDMKYGPDTELGLRWAGYVGVRDAYLWDPATQLPGTVERDVLGIEAPIWSETLPNMTAVEYMAMPRLPALAEVGWSPQRVREWEDFRGRLATHAPRWRRLGINYHPSIEIPW